MNGLPWKQIEIILSFLRLHTSTAFWILLLTMMATLFLLRDSELNSPIPIHFSSLIPKMSMFTLAISCLATFNLYWFMDLTSIFLCDIVLYSMGLYLHHQSHLQLGIVFTLAPSLHSFWCCFSTDLQQHIEHLPTWGAHLSVSYLFAFSHCSWDSQGKNTEVVCRSLLQWTTFCQNSPPWPISYIDEPF